MNEIIYLDNAATTQIEGEVLNAMMPYFYIEYANPSAAYTMGESCKNAIENSRMIVASTLNCYPEEIYFTSGGTESDNWVISKFGKRGHIITSQIEHKAILEPCKDYQRLGNDVSYIDVDDKGKVNIDDLFRSIRKNTHLISIMYANNEIGTIQPISQIGNLAHRHGITFHTDAVQAYGHIPIDVKREKIKMLSASAHKFNGPKGVGFLFIDKSVKINGMILGGGQERGMRSGTENVPGIVGLGEAALLAHKHMKQISEYETALRNYLIKRIMREIPECILNGDMENRLPNNVNFSFKNVRSLSVVGLLDASGICCSAASACSAGKGNVSHVLNAIGIPKEYANGTVRFTLSKDNTYQQMDYVVEQLKQIISEIRKSN